MFKAKEMVAGLLLGILLTSCSSMKTQDSDEKQKVKTAKVNVQLGIAYLERNDVNRAKRKLLTALDQAPNIPETWYSMAYFLESTGNKEQAKKYYLKALALAPDRGDVQNNYGTYLCRSGQYDDAIDHFMLAVKDPEYLDTSDAYENAGLCALKIPDKKLAYQYFETAITQNPSRPVSLIKLAQLDYDRGDYKKSKIKLDQYLAIAPESNISDTLSANIRHKLAQNYSEETGNEEVEVSERPKRVTYKKYLRSTAIKAKKVHATFKHKSKHLQHTANKKVAKPHASKYKAIASKVKPKSAQPMIVANKHKNALVTDSKKSDKAYSWSV